MLDEPSNSSINANQSSGDGGSSNSKSPNLSAEGSLRTSNATATLSSPTSSQESDAATDSMTDGSRSPSPPPIRGGQPSWSASDNDLLCSIIQRRGLDWHAAMPEFNLSSSSIRTRNGIRHNWRQLTRSKNRSPQLIAAMQAVAGARRIMPPLPNAWTKEELDIMRRGLAERKSCKVVFSEYKAKFPSSKRKEVNFRARFVLVARELEAEDDERGSQSEESDDEDQAGAGFQSASKKNQAWSEGDDRLLKLSVENNSPDGQIDWRRAHRAFTKDSKSKRTQVALKARWKFLESLDFSAITPTGLDTSRKRKRASWPKSCPHWTGEELSVLRQILARNDGYVPSQSQLWDTFYKSFPDSKRSPVGLLSKCRRLAKEQSGQGEEASVEVVSENGGEEEEEGNELEGEREKDREEEQEMEEDEETDDSEEESHEDDDSFEPSVVLPRARRRAMQTRSSKRVRSTDTSKGQAGQINDAAQAQSPIHPPAAEAQQLRALRRSGGTSRAAQSAAPTAAAPSPAPSSSLQTPPSFHTSSTPEGISIHGCFPGLEVLVFPGGDARVFHDASAVPAYDESPILHLRCLDGGAVRPIARTRPVSIMTSTVLSSAGGATAEVAAGGSTVMIGQTTFVVDGFSVVMTF